MMPADARLYVVRDLGVVPAEDVRVAWKRFEFLRGMKLESRGWLNDVLAVVRKIGKDEFTLDEVYGFEKELKYLHPENFHVRDKIRQQLQLLRDRKIIEFIENGYYRLI
jgi:type II restriction enzyme